MKKQYLPSLKSLQFFKEAGKSLSFKLAALNLNVSQAAVSQQIKSLEDYLGKSLFIRVNRTIQLSDTGQRLLPYIEQGFDQFYRGLSAISDDTSPNILRVSAIHSFTSLWLMPRLQDFQDDHPELMIQIAPSNELTNFETDEVDLAIRMGLGDYPELHEIKLMSDKLVFVASPELLKKLPNAKIEQPQDLFKLPWIEDPSPQTRLIMKRVCADLGIDSDSLVASIRSDNSMIMIEHALNGKGFTLVNRALAAKYLLSGELIQAIDFTETSPWSLYLVAPEHHFSWPKVQMFKEWLIPELRKSFTDVEAW
jgi:LysR family glycine cleavage system transcriptional activator